MVPHFLPGENPFLREFAAKHAMPQEGCAAAPRPCCQGGSQARLRCRSWPRRTAASSPSQQESHLQPGDVRAVHVQGNVYLVAGAGTNIAVQVGEDGVIVVDTGATATDKALAVIKELAKEKEIRWIVNTSFRPDHTGGQRSLRERRPHGQRQSRGDRRARERRGAHGAAPKCPTPRWPFNTYFEEMRDFPFNGEPVVLYHHAAVTR